MKSFLREVRSEMRKVSWPTKNDLYKTTLAVVVSSILFGLYLFGVDFVFSKIINQVIALLK